MNDTSEQSRRIDRSASVNRNDALKNPAQPVEQVNVSLDVVWHGAAGKYDARLSEISLDGCFIDSMGQEVLGETIAFNVRLPSGIWVKLDGTVVYQEYPIGFEVRFTNLDEEKRRLLMQVVAAHGGKQARQILDIIDNRAPQTAAVAVSEKRRVLLADDDPTTLQMLTFIAEAMDYEAVRAADGREAFRILQHDARFSCAVFDMMMPHLHGLDLIHHMKTDARLASIPIGMITGEQDPKIWDDSAAAGASIFLAKPFTPPQVQLMLRILVGKGEI